MFEYLLPMKEAMLHIHPIDDFHGRVPLESFSRRSLANKQLWKRTLLSNFSSVFSLSSTSIGMLPAMRSGRGCILGWSRSPGRRRRRCWSWPEMAAPLSKHLGRPQPRRLPWSSRGGGRSDFSHLPNTQARFAAWHKVTSRWCCGRTRSTRRASSPPSPSSVSGWLHRSPTTSR